MTAERDRLVERRDLVNRDLEELEAQVEVGEIAPETADRLRAAYREELESLAARLRDTPDLAPEAVEAATSKPGAAGDGGRTRRSPRAVVAWSLLAIGALTVAIAFAARGPATEDDAPPVASGPGDLTIDPATVSDEQLEAVVAANPEIIGMRVALANRYFEAEDYGAALDHYLYIAENATDPTQESQALARIGWMAYVTDLPQEAEQYIQASLRVDPANAEATLFLGFVTLYGLGDAEAAVPQLETALELGGLSADVVEQLEAALAEARAGSTP
jgi:tetratricopeptide (TPR) repeat protein